MLQVVEDGGQDKTKLTPPCGAAAGQHFPAKVASLPYPCVSGRL